MKNMNLLMICALGILFTSGLCYAETEENLASAQKRMEMRQTFAIEDGEHVQVGSRALPHGEEVQIEEERAKLREQEECSAKEEVLKKQKIALSFMPSQKNDVVTKGQFFYSHPGALYHPIAVTPACDQLTLNDGSVWSVHYSDRNKLLSWLPSDTVVIKANDGWFTSYKFMLINQVSGDCIEANMLEGPLYNGMYSHWIIAIDSYNQQLMLEDGTIWQLSPADTAIIKYWLINDTIMIGINDSWFSKYDSILINVKMLNYARAKNSL